MYEELFNISENEGILQCLIDNKIVSEVIRRIETGYVSCPVCKLLIEPIYEEI